MKSILQKNKRICFLCVYLHGDDHEQFTHCHHAVHGTANRKLSERYGLKYYLCPMHHEFSPEAVHRNKDIDTLLIKAAEIVFITKHGADKWMEIFEKNWLSDSEKRIKAIDAAEAVRILTKPEEAAAFELIDDQIPDDLPF